MEANYMMDKTEAVEIVSTINKQMELTLTRLLELYRREGWKALNYPSGDMLVSTELGLSAAEITACWQEMPERWKKDVNFQQE